MVNNDTPPNKLLIFLAFFIKIKVDLSPGYVIIYHIKRKDKYMKYFITLITIFVMIFTFLTWGLKTANASEYEKAVIGSVIQSKANGINVDTSKLMEQELEKIAHKFALESVSILQQYLPTILDGVLAEMRLKADKEYKCSLLKGSKIEDDCK